MSGHAHCKHDQTCKCVFDHSDVNVYFMEDEFYGDEAEQRIHVSVGKSRRIATALMLRIIPLSIDDVESVVNIDRTCPEKCSCECQITTHGMYGTSKGIDVYLYLLISRLFCLSAPKLMKWCDCTGCLYVVL